MEKRKMEGSGFIGKANENHTGISESMGSR